MELSPPMSELTPAPQYMERSGSSSESGSNSSLGTVYFSNRASNSSYAGSAASSPSPRSPASAPGVFVSGPSTQFSHTNGTQSTKSVSSVETRNSSKGCAFDSKCDRGSTEQARQTHEEADATSENPGCCCRNCSGGIPGDLAAICCCPLSLVGLLACLCFKCPKEFASRTVEKVKSKKRTKDQEGQEEEGDTWDDGPQIKRKTNSFPSSSYNSSSSRSSGSTVIACKIDLCSGFEDQHSYFFPTPDVEAGIQRPR